MKKTLLLAALALPLLSPAVLSPTQAADSVYSVGRDDPQMTAAIARARKELPKFIWILNHPNARRSQINIKVRFEEGDQTEYMWLDKVSYDGKVFRGVLDNTPLYVKGYKYGDRLVIQRELVADWKWVEKGKLVGGYTIRAIRNGLSPKERAAYDKELDFKFD